jgi:hypothetical protein
VFEADNPLCSRGMYGNDSALNPVAMSSFGLSYMRTVPHTTARFHRSLVQLFHGKPSIIGGGNYCTVLDALILLLLIFHHTRGHGKPAIEPASYEA